MKNPRSAFYSAWLCSALPRSIARESRSFLFLQSYRLKLGGGPVFYGVILGLLFTGIVAILTFMAHQKLPYRKMLVLTGAMLGAVLLVMVGEEAQEMQFGPLAADDKHSRLVCQNSRVDGPLVLRLPHRRNLGPHRLSPQFWCSALIS